MAKPITARTTRYLQRYLPKPKTQRYASVTGLAASLSHLSNSTRMDDALCSGVG